MSRLYRGGVRRDCPCGHILGVQRGDALHLSFGEAHVVIRGGVWLLCPACQRPTTLDTAPVPRKVASCAP